MIFPDWPGAGIDRGRMEKLPDIVPDPLNNPSRKRAFYPNTQEEFFSVAKTEKTIFIDPGTRFFPTVKR
jgi:hypothetical protein